MLLLPTINNNNESTHTIILVVTEHCLCNYSNAYTQRLAVLQFRYVYDISPPRIHSYSTTLIKKCKLWSWHFLYRASSPRCLSLQTETLFYLLLKYLSVCNMQDKIRTFTPARLLEGYHTRVLNNILLNTIFYFIISH